MIKVLIADEREEREKTAAVLRQEGYQVEITEDAEQGLYQYEQQQPDVLLLSTTLHTYSGMELLKMIRMYDKDVLILLFADTDDEAVRLAAYDALADDYLLRSDPLSLLARRLRVLLRRSGKLHFDMLEYDRVSLDVDGYRAYWDASQELALTATEFDLLKTLIQNHGRIMSRMQLLDRVRGYDYAGDERVVDAHIKNLRRKLPENIILTAKGMGYLIK